MAQELEWAFTTLDRDPRVKVIILTGSGDTFCAGADLEIGFSVGEKGKEKLNLRDYRDRWDTTYLPSILLTSLPMTKYFHTSD